MNSQLQAIPATKTTLRHLTVPEVADLLHLSVRKVWNLIHTGSLPYKRYGRSVRILESALGEYIAKANYGP